MLAGKTIKALSSTFKFFIAFTTLFVLISFNSNLSTTTKSFSNTLELNNDFIANFWNSGMGIAPTYEEWLDWYITYTGENGYQFNNRNYAWLPVGNILPLLLMALAYIVILFVKRNKTAQL